MLLENPEEDPANKDQRGVGDLNRQSTTEMKPLSLLVISLRIPPNMSAPNIKKIISEIVEMWF